MTRGPRLLPGRGLSGSGAFGKSEVDEVHHQPEGWLCSREGGARDSRGGAAAPAERSQRAKGGS